jgi:flagellar operon protein
MRIEDIQIERNVYPLHPSDSPPVVGTRSTGIESIDKSKSVFADVLQETIRNHKVLKFSSHALERINERQMQISTFDLERLEKGVKNVEQKGSKSSLILVDDNAYIVSINNKTVITAMSKEASLENVFTNIDSVAIM